MREGIRVLPVWSGGGGRERRAPPKSGPGEDRKERPRIVTDGGQTATESELPAGERALQRLHQVAASTDHSQMEKISRMLDVGRERLGVDLGFLTQIDEETQEIVESVGDHPQLQPGSTAPLEEAYCRKTIDREEPLAVDDAIEEGWESDPAYGRFNLGCYLGAAIYVDGDQYGTVCFADLEPRGRDFTHSEETFVEVLTDWVSYILEQRAYEQERQSHYDRLSGLLDTTQQLMQARDRTEVAEIAAKAADDVLGFDINMVRVYDAEAGTLVPAGESAATSDHLGERPVYDVGEGLPGEVFATGEPRIVDDLETVDAEVPADGIGSAMYYPVGVHGTISVGAVELAAFDETDRQVLALLATAAAAAFTRAKREREIREAREHVETVLERVNGLIENTIEVLVEATTRDELEAGVVDQLAAADPYTFAWVGRPAVATDTVSPSAWAGAADLPVEDATFELTDGRVVGDAYTAATAQVRDDITADAQWAELVAGTPTRSMMVVPLVYKDTSYGVLAVLSDEADAFDEREQVVLSALGRAVANAINAVERGRILDADKIIELEFAIDDSGLLFSRLSRAAACTLTAAGTDYRSDGTLQVYLTAEGVDGEELAQLARDDEAVSEATCIVNHEDGCLVELVVEESLVATLTEYGAVPRDVVASEGQARFTVELPYEAEARELYDLVEEQYPRTDLVGYHERERPVQTRQEFRAALSDRFTDRQETALRTAFLGGFFEWPRQIDGNELADAMDISRPTYHQHLRAAQQKVFEELFDPEP
ncbi:bacterio-opsin activator domain-containing protein [Salinibaculum rarum]|uniref:bacterio-opsin activator domain-containing protein n=1 Tax=Salinibaculum rarum TaxID=3058903 RepID=UPI00266012B3|nr:bacterio-opsin activator domain-containing protein [Salinibaculum sp. KK48]